MERTVPIGLLQISCTDDLEANLDKALPAPQSRPGFVTHGILLPGARR
jgi:hypothetical protein